MQGSKGLCALLPVWLVLFFLTSLFLEGDRFMAEAEVSMSALEGCTLPEKLHPASWAFSLLFCFPGSFSPSFARALPSPSR